MKKIIIVLALVGTLSFASSCEKCNTCTGTKISEFDHDYCTDVYRTKTLMEDAKENCEAKGGTWTAK